MAENNNISIREYVERLLAEADLRYQQRFDAQQEGLRQALNNSKEAVLKAEVAMEKRFDNTNEWRQTSEDLANKKLGRDEFEHAHKVLEDKINTLQKRVDTREGSTTGIGLSITTGIALSALGLAIWAAAHH